MLIVRSEIKHRSHSQGREAGRPTVTGSDQVTVINLKTVKTLGLTVLPGVLATADEVNE